MMVTAWQGLAGSFSKCEIWKAENWKWGMSVQALSLAQRRPEAGIHLAVNVSFATRWTVASRRGCASRCGSPTIPAGFPNSRDVTMRMISSGSLDGAEYHPTEITAQNSNSD